MIACLVEIPGSIIAGLILDGVTVVRIQIQPIPAIVPHDVPLDTTFTISTNAVGAIGLSGAASDCGFAGLQTAGTVGICRAVGYSRGVGLKAMRSIGNGLTIGYERVSGLDAKGAVMARCDISYLMIASGQADAGQEILHRSIHDLGILPLRDKDTHTAPSTSGAGDGIACQIESHIASPDLDPVHIESGYGDVAGQGIIPRLVDNDGKSGGWCLADFSLSLCQEQQAIIRGSRGSAARGGWCLAGCILPLLLVRRKQAASREDSGKHDK